MAGLVAAAHIGFRLHDAARQDFAVQAADQDFSQQGPGGLQGVLGVEFTGKPCHFLTSVLQYKFARPRAAQYI